MAELRAMILAAGRGERMKPLTDAAPKPLLQVAGKPLIEWHIEKLARTGFKHLVINTGWLGEQLPKALGDGSRWNLNIDYSHEGWPALETGGGLFHALPLLKHEPFLVVNGDVWTDWVPVDTRLPAAWREETLAHLILVPNPPQHPAGDFGLQDGWILGKADQQFTFSGVGYYHPELFKGCTGGAFKLAPLLYAAAAQRRISGELHQGQWHDIGTPERLQQLDALLRSR